MKKIWLILLILLISSTVMAEEIYLPSEHKAKAYVVKAEKKGLWEKTLIVQFPEKRRVLSTNEGLIEALAVVNHSAHPKLWKKVCEEKKEKNKLGGKVYMEEIKENLAKKIKILSKEIAIMATAADMDNLAIVTKAYPPFLVTALVTAGAKTNALRTGVDEGKYMEDEKKPGTVNIILLINSKLTDGALARTIITATEAKTAAFQDLKVPSSYTKGIIATGTGTDNMIVVSGVKEPLVSYVGGHSKIGELIGKAVYEAVVIALEKQNGFKKLP